MYEAAVGTLYLKTTNTWHHGGNIPGKPRVFMPYIAGVGTYRAECEEIVASGYSGFEITPADLPVKLGEAVAVRT